LRGIREDELEKKDNTVWKKYKREEEYF